MERILAKVLTLSHFLRPRCFDFLASVVMQLCVARDASSLATRGTKTQSSTKKGPGDSWCLRVLAAFLRQLKDASLPSLQ